MAKLLLGTMNRGLALYESRLEKGGALHTCALQTRLETFASCRAGKGNRERAAILLVWDR